MRLLSVAGILPLVICYCALGQAQTINTLAGNGTQGYAGDNGPATSAQLNYPLGAAVDSAGNLYIADTGNLFVGAAGNHRIRRVSPDGVITTVAGTGTQGYTGDNGPAISAQLNYPAGVAVDSAGNLYIADTGNFRIRKVSNGVITTVAGTGMPGYSGDNGPATSAPVNPIGVAVDSAGNLYIADSGRIREVSNGVITTIAGTGSLGHGHEEGLAINAVMSPQAVAVDSAGNVYVSDGDLVRKVSNGMITTVAGDPSGTFGYNGDNIPATSASLNNPWGVVVDSSGNLYIADCNNQRIRKVANGAITTVAGNGTPGFSGDNGPAVGAQLSYAHGVAVDSGDNLYIADSNNHSIRLVHTGVAALLSIVTTSPLPQGAAGGAYSLSLSASGGVPPYAWSVASGALPAGLTLASGGTVSGTPSAAGAYSFTAQVRDSAAATAAKEFALTVQAPNSPLAITTASPLLSGWVGGSYSQGLSATGGVGPYAWSAISGPLPGGLTLSSGGLISGTPTATGTSTLTVRVVDSAATPATVAESFTLTIIAGAAGGASLPRAGVLAHVAAGATWDSEIWLVNNSASAVPVSVVFHGDDGAVGFRDSNWKPVTVPMSATLQGVLLGITPTTVDAVLDANSAMVIITAAASQTCVASGWADVLSTGTSLAGFCVFRSTGLGEGIEPLQTQTGPRTLILPFDNTTGQYVTGIAVANIATSAATITATAWDVNGASLLTGASVTYHAGDANGHASATWPAGGHDSFLLNTAIPQTDNTRGIIQLQTSSGALTGVGLRVGLLRNTFTSVPITLQ